MTKGCSYFNRRISCNEGVKIVAYVPEDNAEEWADPHGWDRFSRGGGYSSDVAHFPNDIRQIRITRNVIDGADEEFVEKDRAASKEVLERDGSRFRTVPMPDVLPRDEVCLRNAFQHGRACFLQ